MNRIALLACAVLAFAVTAQAQLEDIEFDGSNQLRYDNGREADDRRAGLEYPDNTIRRYFVENRLLLNLFSGDFHLGGRYLYFRPSETDVDQFQLNEVNRFDKRFFEGSIAPFEFRFGHFSDLWGSGLAFSAFENRDLYWDSELDGARVQLNAGSIKLIGATGSTESGALVPKMNATAGRLELSPGQGRRLGFSYVRHDSLSFPEMHVAAVDWNLSRGIFNLYGERAWNEVVLPGDNSAGHATFVGFTITKSGWSLLSEYANYDYRRVTPMQNPATLYRELGPHLLQGREPHVLNIADEVGLQIELTGTIGEATYVTAHYNASSRHTDDDDVIPLPTLEEQYRGYWEYFANVEHDFAGGQHAFLELGANEEASVVWHERRWVQARAKFPFRDTQELEFETEQMLITDHTRADDEFHDMYYSVSWAPSSSLSANASLQLTNDEDLKKREGDFWAGGEVAWQIAGGKHRAMLFYGRERGGLKCSNGVCRQVQPFAGVRFTLETSF